MKVLHEDADVVIRLLDEPDENGARIIIRAKGAQGGSLSVQARPGLFPNDKALFLIADLAVFVANNVGAWPAISVVSTQCLADHPFK